MDINEFKKDINGKSVAVIGIGISNIPLIDFLLDAGASVCARDKKTAEQLGDVYGSLIKKGVKVVCGDGYLDGIQEKIIFKSPGIRADIAPLAECERNGAVITGEMDLFCKLCPCKIIAVTGSDGKTTTTTLISLILKKQRELDGAAGKVWVGGNIGTPLLSYVDEMSAGDIAVLELSSFQLHRMKFSPFVSVITNITPNHLNWHTDMDEYIESKTHVYAYQTADTKTVLNHNCEITRKLGESAGSRVMYFNDENGVYCRDGKIYCNGQRWLDTADIKIPGRHNVDNYMTAIAALCELVSPEAVSAVAKDFGGVQHRIEFVREVDGVKYYNSSIDSSPTRTIAALRSFSQKLIVILGGYDKNIPYEPLIDPLFEHVKTAVLTGQTADKLYELIKADGRQMKICREATFEGAVQCARECAKPGDIVLLSPAAASFDMFANFEKRGEKFKDIVNKFRPIVK